MLGVTHYANRIIGGPWLADPNVADNYLPGPAQLDASQFPAVDAVTIVVSTDTAANATALPVNAISGPIPSGTIIWLGGKKFARLSAAAAKNATSLVVSALPTAVVATDTGTYNGVGVLVVPGGTYVGRTQAEADAGTPFGPATSSDDYLYLIGGEVNLRETDGCYLVRHGRAIKENFLPGYTAIAANSGLLATLRAKYECIKGQR